MDHIENKTQRRGDRRALRAGHFGENRQEFDLHEPALDGSDRFLSAGKNHD